jgi:hypothetical protein
MTCLIFLASLPTFFGVLQMLAMQNPPQRHVSSLYEQKIFPVVLEIYSFSQ